MRDMDDIYTELLNIRGSLETVLNRVDNLIDEVDDILDENDETLDAIEVPSLTGEYEDTFSEEKEGFMAP